MSELLHEMKGLENPKEVLEAPQRSLSLDTAEFLIVRLQAINEVILVFRTPHTMIDGRRCLQRVLKAVHLNAVLPVPVCDIPQPVVEECRVLRERLNQARFFYGIKVHLPTSERLAIVALMEQVKPAVVETLTAAGYDTKLIKTSTGNSRAKLMIIRSCLPADVKRNISCEGKKIKIYINSIDIVDTLKDRVDAAIKKYFLKAEIEVIYDEHVSPSRNHRLKSEQSTQVPTLTSTVTATATDSDKAVVMSPAIAEATNTVTVKAAVTDTSTTA
jgi:hypothetical protein